MEEEIKPTIEEIKQIADTKRKLKNPTKYNTFVKEQMEKLKDENISQKEKLSAISKQWKDQKEPLPPPKEFKRRVKKEPKSQPEPEPEIKSEPELKGPEPEPEPEQRPELINNDFITLHENINSIKQLLEEVMKSKSKPKPKPRPTLKRVNKTLDLTINDKEIEDIINVDKKKDKTQDEKLKAFLDAMTKNKK
jgi:hypothetical protein